MHIELNDVISFNATDYATYYFGYYTDHVPSTALDDGTCLGEGKNCKNCGP